MKRRLEMHTNWFSAHGIQIICFLQKSFGSTEGPCFEFWRLSIWRFELRWKDLLCRQSEAYTKDHHQCLNCAMYDEPIREMKLGLQTRKFPFCPIAPKYTWKNHRGFESSRQNKVREFHVPVQCACTCAGDRPNSFDPSAKKIVDENNTLHRKITPCTENYTMVFTHSKLRNFG